MTTCLHSSIRPGNTPDGAKILQNPVHNIILYYYGILGGRGELRLEGGNPVRPPPPPCMQPCYVCAQALKKQA